MGWVCEHTPLRVLTGVAAVSYNIIVLFLKYFCFQRTLSSSACNQLTISTNEVSLLSPFMLFSKHTSHSNHHINRRGYHLPERCWPPDLPDLFFLQLKTSRQLSLTDSSPAIHSRPLPAVHPADRLCVHATVPHRLLPTRHTTQTHRRRCLARQVQQGSSAGHRSATDPSPPRGTRL